MHVSQLELMLQCNAYVEVTVALLADLYELADTLRNFVLLIYSYTQSIFPT